MFTIKFRSLFVVLLLSFSLLLHACAPRQVVSLDQPTAVPPTQGQEPPAGKLPAGRPLAHLVEALAKAGLQVTEGGPHDSTLLDSLSASALQVNGQPVFVYDYGSSEAAALAAERVSPDGYSLVDASGAISSVHWIGAPHFWLSGSFIIQYLGVDEAVLAGMKTALGEPFASGLNTTPAVDSNYRLLWRDVRQPTSGIGFAVPCWWQVSKMPAEGVVRSQTARSYDDAFFQAHSVRGEWQDGVWPDGAFKLDISLFELSDPSQETAAAYTSRLDSTLEKAVGVEEAVFGSHTWVAITVQSVLQPEQPAVTLYLYRLAQNQLLIVAAYPQPAAPASPVLQAILASFALTGGESVVLPEVDPGIKLVEGGCVQ